MRSKNLVFASNMHHRTQRERCIYTNIAYTAIKQKKNNIYVILNVLHKNAHI